MKILLFGKNGQVGWELQRALAPLGDLIALDREGDQGLCGDLTDLADLSDTVRSVRPDLIVNAAAYTAVDKAESEPELARLINGDAPGLLAREAESLGAWLVHYSTDYVFDGSGEQGWYESDPVGPLNVYGTTKLEGEQRIRESGCNSLIFRTSWVYGAHGGNFAKTMLRLARERTQLRVIDDQIGAPTGAELLADVTAHAVRVALQRPDTAGLYHLAASGETSWYGYAAFVLDCAQRLGQSLSVTPETLEPIPTTAYPTPAARPKNSRLNTDNLRQTFDLNLPDWRSGVERVLAEILES